MLALGRLSKEPKEALGWYEKSAAKGNTAAKAYLALLYADGKEVRKDSRKALELAKSAAEKKDLAAMTLLGRMYYEGDGVEKSAAEAMKYLLEPAEQGEPYAVEKVGRMLYDARDYAKAEKYLESAVKKSKDPADMYRLGMIAYRGSGVKQDFSKAYDWFVQAAEKKMPPPCIRSGVCTIAATA